MTEQKTVTFTWVILENTAIKEEWAALALKHDTKYLTTVRIPEGVTPGVPQEVYTEYRKGRSSACVDIVLVTRLEDGTPAVLMSFREPNVCYGNKWWIYGGALRSYCSLEDFISERATKECGVPVEAEVVIGTYMTMSEDFIGATLQVCYATRVPIDVIRAKMATDPNHSKIRLFTLAELEEIPIEQQHEYPIHVSKVALNAIPTETKN